MQPFSGVRVLDLTHVFAGPFAAHQLGVLGAEVIKIEPPDQPDMMRSEGCDPALNDAGMGLGFQTQGAGKRTLALDLKSSAGRKLFDRLVERSDILIQNYSAGAAARLGLEYDRLRPINPSLIYCSISGFGQTGPKAEHPAYDSVIQAFAGVMASNGTHDRHPVRIGPAVVDYGTGVQAALAISAALFGRAQTGQGRCIDVAMTDAALMLMASHMTSALATGQTPLPHGNSDPGLAGYAWYETADGPLMIGAYTNRQMANLMQAVGNPKAANDILATPRAAIAARHDQDRAFLKTALRTRNAAEWEEILNACHVPAARVRGLAESIAEPQIASRPVLQDVGAPVPLPVAGYTYDAGAPALAHAPRAHGADSRAVLSEIGVGDSEFATLLAQGVVHAPPAEPCGQEGQTSNRKVV